LVFACSAYDEASPEPLPPGPDGGPTGDATGDAPEDAEGARPWLPKEGIYRYRVDGQQHLAFDAVQFSEYRDEGPVAPAEIRYEASEGCWRFRLCLVSGKCDDKPATAAYSEIAWSFCAAGGRLEERGMREVSHWSVLGEVRKAVSEVTCVPGQSQYAATDLSITSWSQVCSGVVDGKASLGFSTGGTYRYLGEENVTVGSAPVRAFRYAQERIVTTNAPTGAPEGRQIAEWWLAPNGLPLRVRRGARIETNVGFGRVTFMELPKTRYDAGAGAMTMNDCVLDSLEPGALPLLDAGPDAAADGPAPPDASSDAGADG
jgi:hypothetical protein